MKGFLCDRGWTSDSDAKAIGRDPVVQQYLTTCLQPALGEKLTSRNLHEMQTIAETIDLILKGKVTDGAELLLQRFKSLELFSLQGNWNQARHLELTKDHKVTCVSAREQQLAVASELQDRKLKPQTGAADGRQSPSR